VHLTDDAFDVFPPTAAGVLAFVATTRPEPLRADVLAHIRRLAESGVMLPAEVEKLAAAGYPEVRT